MSREAFAEVQKKLVDHQKQYRHLQQQQQTQHREALQAKLTADELEKLSDAPVYKAIGAPFFFLPRPAMPGALARRRWPGAGPALARRWLTRWPGALAPLTRRGAAQGGCSCSRRRPRWCPT